MNKTLFETLKKDLKSSKLEFRQIIAITILSIIVIVFIFFGYSAKDSLGSGLVGEVNGYIISPAEFQREYARFEQYYSPFLRQLGNSKSQIEFLKSQALEGLINQILIFQSAEKVGIYSSPHEVLDIIKSISAFQEDGKFRRDRYEGVLKANQWTVSDFERQIYREKVSKRLEWFLNKILTPASTESDLINILSKIQRKIEYVSWDSSEWEKSLKISSEELDRLLKDSEFNDRLQKEFESQKETLSQPEQIKARHILVKITPEFDETKALAKINNIKKTLTSKNFAQIAKQVSEDEGSKNKGGDLGFFTRGTMVNQFEDYAFSAPLGKISDPIKTDFGYHLIEVTEKKPEKKASFEEHKMYLASLIWARENYDKELEKLTNLLSDQNIPEVLALLKKWGFEWKESEWFTLTQDHINGISGNLTPEKIWHINAKNAFTNELIRDGGRVYLIRFKEEKDNKILSDVSEISKNLQREKFNEVFGRFLQKFKENSKIVKNPQIFSM